MLLLLLRSRVGAFARGRPTPGPSNICRNGRVRERCWACSYLALWGGSGCDCGWAKSRAFFVLRREMTASVAVSPPAHLYPILNPTAVEQEASYFPFQVWYRTVQYLPARLSGPSGYRGRSVAGRQASTREPLCLAMLVNARPVVRAEWSLVRQCSLGWHGIHRQASALACSETSTGNGGALINRPLQPPPVSKCGKFSQGGVERQLGAEGDRDGVAVDVNVVCNSRREAGSRTGESPEGECRDDLSSRRSNDLVSSSWRRGGRGRANPHARTLVFCMGRRRSSRAWAT